MPRFIVRRLAAVTALLLLSVAWWRRSTSLTAGGASVRPPLPVRVLVLPPPPPPPLTVKPSTRSILRATVVDDEASRASDPRRVPWGDHVELRGPPPAIVVLAPHKTGSTFFAPFLHDLAARLGLCWYTENAAFMYAPSNHTKCASPSCGHTGRQRRFEKEDRGWGECASFADERLRAASLAVAAQTSPATALPLSAHNGVLWGPLRTPFEVRATRTAVGKRPWRWLVLLHSRHPGDTLVSQFHSFGWTHPPPPGASAEQLRAHAARQATIRNTTLAEYVTAHLPELRLKYATYTALRQAAPPHVHFVRSRYEELVTDFDGWLRGLLAPLAASYSELTLTRMHAQLLAKHAHSFAPDGKHKRSVTPGRFRAEIPAPVASRLLRVHHAWWRELGYG